MGITATVACTLQLSNDGWVSGPDSMGTVVISDSPACGYVASMQQGETWLVAPIQGQFSYLMIDPIQQNQGLLNLKGTPTDGGVNVSAFNPSLIPLGTSNLNFMTDPCTAHGDKEGTCLTTGRKCGFEGDPPCPPGWVSVVQVSQLIVNSQNGGPMSVAWS